MATSHRREYLLQELNITSSSRGIVVPPGTEYMQVLLIGGGGAGAKFQCDPSMGGGGGGGGGMYYSEHVAEANKTIDVVIGQGGAIPTDTDNNGGNGEDTSLTYGKNTRIAYGGKGGKYGGEGGLGGGFSIFGDGREGKAGSNGTPSVGGNGGTSVVPPASEWTFGFGGNGGSKVCGFSTENKNVCFTNESEEINLKQLLSKGNYLSCKKCLEERKTIMPTCAPLSPCEDFFHPLPFPIPPLNSTGNPGNPGFCQIKFYTSSSKFNFCFRKEQNITLTEDTTDVVYLDPNVKIITIDAVNTSTSTQLYLLPPCSRMCKIPTLTIKLKESLGSVVIATFANGGITGSFNLSAAQPIVHLYFIGKWQFTPQTDNSFYPTTQTSPTLLMPNYSNPGGVFVTRVALSTDGKTAAVGIPSDNSLVGAVYVFVKVEGTLTAEWQFQAKLMGNDNFPLGGPSAQGWSVAISADGNTIAFGGYVDNASTGAAWVFKRKYFPIFSHGCTIPLENAYGQWVQQGPKLVGLASSPGDETGWGLALAANGRTLFVGAPGYLSNSTQNGSVLVYTLIGDSWTFSIRIVGAAGDQSGMTLATSADGTTLISRGGNPSSNITTYSLQNGSYISESVITPVGPVPSLTGSLALSSDGNILAIGQQIGDGSATIYIRSGGIWTIGAANIMGVPFTNNPGEGLAVALSNDGKTLAIAGAADNANTGAVWIFTETGGNWIQREKLIGVAAIVNNSNIPFIFQGISVSLSGDGAVLLVSSASVPGYEPQAWIFD